MVNTSSPRKLLIEHAMKYNMSEKENILKFYNDVSEFVRYHPTVSGYGNDLDFGIITSEDGTYIELQGVNLISALAMCDVFPENFNEVILENVYVDKEFKYTFNSEEKFLVKEKI